MVHSVVTAGAKTCTRYENRHLASPNRISGSSNLSTKKILSEYGSVNIPAQSFNPSGEEKAGT
jgi:hypothetical protein